MKKLTIQHKEFTVDVIASRENTKIIDSYKVKTYYDMESIIYYIIKAVTTADMAVNKRGVMGMVSEWRVHNLLYSLGMFKSRTKDVDLDAANPWYMKILYLVLSPLYLHFR